MAASALEEFSWEAAELKSLQAALSSVEKDSVNLGEAQDLIIQHCTIFGRRGFDIALESDLFFDCSEAAVLAEGKAVVVAELQHALQMVADDVALSPCAKRVALAGVAPAAVKKFPGKAVAVEVQENTLGSVGKGLAPQNESENVARRVPAKAPQEEDQAREQERLRLKLHEDPSPQRRYSRRVVGNLKRSVLREGEQVLLGGPEGLLPRFWEVREK